MTTVRQFTLYVVRHGECQHNVEGWIASHNDSPLTERGRAQARSTGRLLRELEPSADGLDYFASSLHRACVTMELLREAAGLSVHGYRADHRLMEQHTGDHIGIRMSEIDEEADARYRADPWNFRRPGGESHGDVFIRVGRFLETLTRDAVIVTHAQPARMLRAHWLGLDPEATMAYAVPNAGILRLSPGSESYFGD